MSLDLPRRFATARGQRNGWDEPCKSRGLRTVLWAAGGEIPPADPAAAQPRPNSAIPVNGEVCTGKAFDQKRLTQTKLMEKQPISRLFRSANIGGEAADAGFSQAA